jgi:hypothetical protein
MVDDDQTWLETLAGRGHSGSEGTDASEALVLRELIGAQLQEDGTAVAEVDAQREAALIMRARVEGLLPAQGATRSARRVWWLTSGALAATAILASIILSLLRNAPVSENFRGMDGGTVRIESSNPQALKDRLLRELDAIGIHATGYDRLGRLGIDADLPQPLPPAVQHLLEKHHIPLPNDGVLTVEIEDSRNR